MVRRRKGANGDHITNNPKEIGSGDDRSSESAEVADLEGPPVFEHVHTCLFTSALVFSLYLITLHPSVPGGDSGELIVVAHELGVAHPPGYPLFTLLARLAMFALPLRSLAWRVNVLNAFLSAASAGVLQMTVLKLTNDTGASVFAVGLFSLSRLTWTYSVVAEVFSLNNLLVALLLYTAVRFERANMLYENSQGPRAAVTKVTYLGVFLSGLALCNQHTVILYVIPIAMWVLSVLWRHRMLSLRFLATSALCFCLGLLPYAYLPLSATWSDARMTWGDAGYLRGFITHLTRTEYGTFDLGKDQEGLGFSTFILTYLEHCHANLCSVGPYLALIGCACSVTYYRNRLGEGCLFVFILMTSFYVTFFAWRANLDVTNPLLHGVVQRFFLQGDLVLVLLATVGLHTLTRVLTPLLLGKHQSAMSYSFSCVAALSVLGLQLQNYSACDASGNLVVRDFASTILHSLPRNAIVLTKGDLPSNSLRYLYLCENMRPDVTLLDVEILSYEWSLPALGRHYDRLTFPGDKWHTRMAIWPDGRRSFNMQLFLDANYHKGEIFACIGMTERDLSWRDGYTLWPFGPCHRVVKATERLDAKQWAHRTGRYAHDWKHPYRGAFDDKSWEKVANDEMWSAKTNTAFFLYAESEKTQDGKVKADMLQSAHEIYMHALTANQGGGRINSRQDPFPPFWHKNFALVCERLLYVEVRMSKANLCRAAILHLELYLASRPQDDDVTRVRAAVESLRTRIDTYQKLDALEDSLGKKL